MSEKIEQFWRSATADDVARVVNGEKIAMRYRESEDDKWSTEKLFLAGYDASDTDGYNWLSNKGDMLSCCQVYDPPAWFVNKPDPGEGFRMLEKFPPESKLPTDEYWSNVCSQWLQIGGSDATPQADRLQVENVWYRRRIETNNPASSDSSRSRDTIPSGWRLLGKDEDRLASDAYWSQGCNEWLLIGDDRVKYANELPKWHAIRKTTNMTELSLIEGFGYVLPGGQTIRITAKGFEVL